MDEVVLATGGPDGVSFGERGGRSREASPTRFRCTAPSRRKASATAEFPPFTGPSPVRHRLPVSHARSAANLMASWRSGVQRRHDLDWLRVIAVFLLLPFHSARVFDPFEDFYVHSAETSEAMLWSVIAFIAVWQMELLFPVLAERHRGTRSAPEPPTSTAPGRRSAARAVPVRAGRDRADPVLPGDRLARRRRRSIPAFTADYWTMHREFGGYDGGFPRPPPVVHPLLVPLNSMVAAPDRAGVREPGRDGGCSGTLP